MKQFKKKLHGNTLVEVLIALAITAFCASMASVIYLNVQKSSLPFFRIKALELAEQYLQKSTAGQSLQEETIHSGAFTLKRAARPHPMLGDCYVITLLVFDNSERKIAALETVLHLTP